MKTIFLNLSILITLLPFCSELKTDLTDKPIYFFDLEKTLNNPNTVPLSEAGSRLDYIPLESNPNCMLGPISKLALTDSYIFISDARKLLQFDRAGKFIRQIGSIGRGPGEYRSVIDFFIDQQYNRIYILNGREIIIYDYLGQYKRSFSTDFVACQIVTKGNNTFFFHDLNFFFKEINPSIKWNFPDTIYSIHITDSTGKTLKKIKHDLRQGNEPYINITSSPMYIHDESVTFLETGNDTAYHLNNGEKECYAVFNLGKIKMNPQLANIEKDAEEVRDKFWIASLTENIDFFFMDLIQGLSNDMSYCLLNKHTGEVTWIRDSGLKNDLDDSIDFWPKQVYKDTILISYIEAHKYLSLTKLNSQENIKEIRCNLTETSNPVIILLNKQ